MLIVLDRVCTCAATRNTHKRRSVGKNAFELNPVVAFSIGQNLHF